MLIDRLPETIDALYAFLAAAVLAVLLVPLAERLARRIGAMDVPNERSIHTTPTPKLGGLAILVGVLVAGVLFLPMGDGARGDETRAILIGAIAIALVGMLDDVFDLPAGVKLLGQIDAAQERQGSWRRSPRARRSASCGTASRRRARSWAIPVRTCSGTCLPASRSRAP
jgi:hypothetical protein